MLFKIIYWVILTVVSVMYLSYIIQRKSRNLNSKIKAYIQSKLECHEFDIYNKQLSSFIILLIIILFSVGKYRAAFKSSLLGELRFPSHLAYLRILNKTLAHMSIDVTTGG